jgi:hypothetical protein
MASEKKRAIYYIYWYKYEVNFFSDLPLMMFSKCFWRHAFVSDQLEPIKNVVTVNSFRISIRSGKHILRICRKLNVFTEYVHGCWSRMRTIELTVLLKYIPLYVTLAIEPRFHNWKTISLANAHQYTKTRLYIFKMRKECFITDLKFECAAQTF